MYPVGEERVPDSRKDTHSAAAGGQEACLGAGEVHVTWAWGGRRDPCCVGRRSRQKRVWEQPESGGSLNLHPGLTVDPPESRRNGRGMPETCHVSGCQAGFKRCQEGHLGSSSGRHSSPDSVPGFLSFGSTLAFPWNISFSHSFVLIGW